MKVALTGATGFIGSHVLTELRDHGHEVTALVRDAARADASKPAAPCRRWSTSTTGRRSRAAGHADGAIHVASPGDASSADLDAAVIDAAIDAFAGTGKPYIHITGVWIYGSNPAIAEESPIDAPATGRLEGPAQPPGPRGERHARRRDRRRRWPTATAGEGCPGCCSAHPGTTPATWS